MSEIGNPEYVESDGPMISGRTLVIVAVGISVAMAVAAWWYRYDQSRRAALFWGPRMSQLLVDADQVTLIELERAEAGGDANRLLAGYRVAASHDLTHSRGLVYVPAALTFDANLDWSAEAPDPTGVEWTRALKFQHGDEIGYVLLSSDMRHLGKLPAAGDEPAVIACPRLAEPLAAFFSTAIPEADAAASSAGQ